MPINLLRLPRLVGVLVVTELLDYQEIFLLSLCSRRTKCLVEKARIKVPKLAFVLKERQGYNEFKVGAIIDNGIRECIWLPVTSVVHCVKLTKKTTSTVKLGNDYEASAKFDMRRQKNGTFLHRMKCANEPMAVQKALQDYINLIFHYSEPNKLYLMMECEGSLPNVTNVQEIEIKHETVDRQFFTNVLTTYPDHHTISVRVINRDIPNEFFQIQNIHVKYANGPDCFRNFVGRNMRLGCATSTDQDLIQFLQKWISNEAYHNLESLTMFIMNDINTVLIRQSVEFEEYDPNEPEKRPRDYVLDIPYVYSFSKTYPIRDQKFVEIKRITDGKRAFLEVSNHQFNFLVLQN
ncbi:unnamed protein product [Caenorhabditis nigoni]